MRNTPPVLPTSSPITTAFPYRSMTSRSAALSASAIVQRLVGPRRGGSYPMRHNSFRFHRRRPPTLPLHGGAELAGEIPGDPRVDMADGLLPGRILTSLDIRQRSSNLAASAFTWSSISPDHSPSPTRKRLNRTSGSRSRQALTSSSSRYRLGLSAVAWGPYR